MSRTATWTMKSVVPVSAITRTVSAAGRPASARSCSVAWRCEVRCWIDRIASIGRPTAAGSTSARKPVIDAARPQLAHSLEAGRGRDADLLGERLVGLPSIVLELDQQRAID